jgi:hypothetical protein
MKIRATDIHGETVWFDMDRARSVRQVTDKGAVPEETRTVITFEGAESITVIEAPAQLFGASVHRLDIE